MLEIIIGVFITYLIGSIFVVRNLLVKLEAKEDEMEEYIPYIESLEVQLKNVYDMLNDTNTRLKEIDNKGSFESDDEVGFTFTNIQKTIEDLNNFINKD